MLAREAGHKVTGCDANVYPPMSTQLRGAGHRADRGLRRRTSSPCKPDLFVIGNVVSRGNPLMEAILDRGLPYVSGPQWLASTCCAAAGCWRWPARTARPPPRRCWPGSSKTPASRPGFLIGGVPLNFGVSARLSATATLRFFVIEADEYDTAFFDKRCKFVHYQPRTAVLNNLEFDHADIFPDLAAIETQFHHLVRTVPGNGRLVVNGARGRRWSACWRAAAGASANVSALRRRHRLDLRDA